MQRRALIVIASVVALAACGGDDEPQAATEAPTTAALITVPATQATATTAPLTAAPTTGHAAATTSPPTTSSATAPPTTESVTTTSATPPPSSSSPSTPGWVASNFVPVAAYQPYSGNWWGEGAEPSPPAPASSEAPADGFYVASVLEPWSPEDADHLSVRIQRLMWCTDLPGGCPYMEPEEMNVDPSWQLDVDVPLDATTDVVVQGFLCWEAPEQKAASGIELRDLFEAYTADYAELIEPRLTGTPSDYDIALELAAAPAGGFVGEETVCPDGLAGPLRYVHDDAPVLLLQTITDTDGGPLDATDLVQLQSVQFAAGVPTFYFYAGFYS